MLLELELKYVQRFVLRQARMIIILVRHFWSPCLEVREMQVAADGQTQATREID